MHKDWTKLDTAVHCVCAQCQRLCVCERSAHKDVIGSVWVQEICRCQTDATHLCCRPVRALQIRLDCVSVTVSHSHKTERCQRPDRLMRCHIWSVVIIITHTPLTHHRAQTLSSNTASVRLRTLHWQRQWWAVFNFVFHLLLWKVQFYQTWSKIQDPREFFCCMQ